LRRPTLDDVFLFLTGHIAEYEEGEEGETADGDKAREKAEVA
jgi:hypothetical protein